MFKPRPLNAAVIASLLVSGALTGCTSTAVPIPSGSAPIASASPKPVDDKSRWGEGTAAKLDDAFHADPATVDPDGDAVTGDMLPAAADDPTKPATIAKNGNIFVQVTVRASNVDRAMVQSYISTDKEGKEVGPSFDCVKSGVNEYQTFKCSVLFKDSKYKTGIYYAAFKSKPTSAEQKSYGTRTQVVPIYTRTWKAMELEYERQLKSSAGNTTP